MYCRICGDENERAGVEYYPSKRQSLCRICAADTPAKVGRAAFDKEYWRGCEGENIPEGVKREFYEDYLASTHGSIASYTRATTSAI